MTKFKTVTRTSHNITIGKKMEIRRKNDKIIGLFLLVLISFLVFPAVEATPTPSPQIPVSEIQHYAPIELDLSTIVVGFFMLCGIAILILVPWLLLRLIFSLLSMS